MSLRTVFFALLIVFSGHRARAQGSVGAAWAGAAVATYSPAGMLSVAIAADAFGEWNAGYLLLPLATPSFGVGQIIQGRSGAGFINAGYGIAAGCLVAGMATFDWENDSGPSQLLFIGGFALFTATRLYEIGDAWGGVVDAYEYRGLENDFDARIRSRRQYRRLTEAQISVGPQPRGRGGTVGVQKRF